MTLMVIPSDPEAYSFRREYGRLLREKQAEIGRELVRSGKYVIEPEKEAS